MQIITVNLIARNSNGEILIVKRAKNDSEGGMWSLPGGTVEKGENLIAALKREIKEELNVDVISSNFKNVINGENIISYYYVCSIKGVIKLNEENSNYRWVLIKDLPKMAFNQHKLFFNLA